MYKYPLKYPPIVKKNIILRNETIQFNYSVFEETITIEVNDK